MGFLLMGLQGLCGIGWLICFIMVLMKMFQVGQTALGVVCIVLVFCIGIGGLVAFIMGWVNATTWNIKNLMLAWTGCWVGAFLFGGLSYATGAAAFPGLGR